jgi:predicted MFS family arabinose efflux permease
VRALADLGAHSLISDYYPRGRRSSALALYSCGLSLGYLWVALLGAYVTQHSGWRAACVAIGLPGVALALLLPRLIAEPVRGLTDGAPRPPPPAASLRAELGQLASTARALFLSWPSANIIAGLTLSSFAAYGSWAFIPAYFPRAFSLSYAEAGVLLGLVGSIPVACGTLAGGFISDWLGQRSARWYALVPAAGLLAATPCYLAALAQRQWLGAALLLALPGFFQYVSLAPSFGVVQNVVAVRQRATATALLFLCLNVLALGGGALFTGFLIDQLAQGYFAQPHLDTAGALAGLLHAPSPPAALFGLSCPGGAAPAAAAPALVRACAAALAQGSRAGIALTLTLHLWAALHYLLGTRGLAAQLRRGAEVPA